MVRTLLLVLLLGFALPAHAKPHKGKQPVSCSDLWNAVTATLRDASNYTIVAVDNENMKADFFVVGALFSKMNAVQLKPHDSGCGLDVHMGFSGNDDEAAFRKRVNRTLEKQQAAKPAAPAKPAPAGPGPAE